MPGGHEGGRKGALARVRIGFEPHAAYLQRLAVVLADPLRLKIIAELFLREMSPTLFFEEFGGGSVSRVARHFDALVKAGWLRYIRSATGGKRFGGVEGFYRARELAVIDNATWAALPYSIRGEFSSKIFAEFSDRVIEAMQAGTFDSRPDRHFTWTPALLDRMAWGRVLAALDALLESLVEEQEDAKLRVFNSGEKPFLATIGLAGFESPGEGREDDANRVNASLAEGTACPVPFSRRISRVFADPVCLKIVAELNLREMSASKFHKEFGGASRSGIHRRFKLLGELGWLRRIRDETGGRRRGATEQFFRATAPAIVVSDSRSGVPDSVRTTDSWSVFEQFSEHFSKAMGAGTVDARVDRHLSWSLLLLDRLGWENAITALDSLFALIFEEQDAAKHRVAESGEKPIRMTVTLAGFESPRDSAKAP
jgi:DNA-binding transcriptional ArsR family regulator